jgi:flagellar biosynthesis/type III secretory pathway protein FliH
MFRKTIAWSSPPQLVRLRSRTAASGHELASPVPHGPSPAVLLHSLGTAIEELEQRRQRSLGELQQVAVELAVAAASHLVFESIQRDAYNVENLVQQAVERMGLSGPITAYFHPADLDLLRQRLAGQPLPWNDKQLTLQPDSGVARGGCRAETPDGRMLVSDITSRLSEIRRHWMEELDDAQIERRRAPGTGESLRRFPDRRETA